MLQLSLMSSSTYEPLFLKYRPQKLDDVLGQSSVKETLINAIRNGKIVHAYLLTGPRGSGKTSTARILAKSLNCTKALDGKSPSAQPCGECPSCVSIANSSSIDVVEIDAASHGGVDDARQIVEKVNLASVSGKYRVYIIDEVHMLSTAAFNALLKVIEEPPANVVFVLATTEVDEVPKTIASRCQQLKFKPITIKDCCDRLEQVAKLESINITQAAIEIIAEHSDGAMRDALSLLDQVGVFSESDKAITEDKIQEILGGIPKQELAELATSIIKRDSVSLINITNELLYRGKDENHIVQGLSDFILQVLESASGFVASNKYASEVLEQCRSEAVENFELVQILDSLTDLEARFRRGSKNKNLLRAWLIKICNRADILVVKDMLARVKELEAKMAGGLTIKKEIIPVKTIVERPLQVAPVTRTSTAAPAAASTPARVPSGLEGFMDYLSPGTKGMCISSQLKFLKVDSSLARMQIPTKFKFLKSKLETRSEEICLAITKALGTEVKSLDIAIIDEQVQAEQSNLDAQESPAPKVELDTNSSPCVMRNDTKLDEIATAGINIFGGKEIS